MVCPHCHADNSDDALSCAQCGTKFAGIDADQTLVEPSGAAPSASPIVSKSATAAGVVSPPPSSASGASWRPSAAFAPAWAPGDEFGPRYRIESLIGEGGMGTVYKAYDKELDRMVALKLVRPELTADPAVMQRFKQELLLASRISHKNILRIHDLGDVGGIKFISMAYIEGEDLHHILKKDGRLPVERAVGIARQLCQGLEAAHAEGIVHRDMKPHNILIDPAGTAYISDFGLAKSFEAAGAGMTRTGQFLGTPRYMSPEQVEAETVDHRSDLYALGLILYEMVTGDVPFTSESTLQAMYLRVNQKPKSPKLLNPELPDYLVRIILRCLEKDPSLRYQGAGEILHDLEAHLAPPRTLRARIRMPSRRAALGGAAALVVLALIGFSVRSIISRRSSQATASRPASRIEKSLAVVPFRVLGEQASLNYVADGIVEALSTKLFQLKDALVASPSAVERASKKDSLEEIARELGVNLIVHGTVQGTGERIRVTVNLEDIAQKRRVWTEEFSGLPQDLLTLEDQMYTKLVAALNLKPTNEELARSSTHLTENIEAYALYLRGRNALRSQQDIKNVEAAIRYFEDALKKDSSFALAYSGLADGSLRMYREKKNSIWSERALAAAQQAQRLDETRPEVHFALGSVYMATGKSAEAVAVLKRALELAPNSDEGYRRLGDAYRAAGRKDEALQACRKAIEINPYYWVNYNALGNASFELGEYEQALSAYRRMTEIEPNNAFGYVSIGSVYLRLGRYEECIAPYQKALSLQPHYATYSNLGTAFFFLKRYQDAVPMFEKAVEMSPNDETAMGNLADAYRWAGQKEKAAATYDRAIALAYKELQVNPRKAGTLESLALYYAKKGDAGRAISFIRRARSIDRNNVDLVRSQAVVQALAGHPEESLKVLREAFEKGFPPEEAKNDPELGSVQSRPEFAQLIREFKGRTN